MLRAHRPRARSAIAPHGIPQAAIEDVPRAKSRRVTIAASSGSDNHDDRNNENHCEDYADVTGVILIVVIVLVVEVVLPLVGIFSALFSQ